MVSIKSHKKILVIVAHPDDEILGCGGTVSLLSSQGADVHFLILGEGLTSRQDKRDAKAISQQMNRLHKDAQKAAKLVGAKSVEIKNLPDNRFDGVDLLDVVKIIEEKKRQIKPTCIFTHHASDLNIDHQVVFRAVMIASRPLENETVREILSFEVPSSSDWQAARSENAFLPTKYVTLRNRDIEAKIAAMQSYSTEKRAFPHPRSAKALRILSSYRGVQIGADMAEAFEVIRQID